MANVDLIFNISKEAMELIKSGQAMLSSGGVRSLAGQMIEMAKPAASMANSLSLGPVGAAVNIVSSLGNNVQSAFIQQGVNAANAKLDNVIDQLGSLSKAMNGLQTINVLSWVNTAFGLANCGISLIGFHMTLSKLEGVRGQLGEFFERYKADRVSDHLQMFQRLLLNLKNELGFLQQLHRSLDLQLFIQREQIIEQTLNETRAFLQRVMDEFLARRIDGVVGCQIIFTLSAVFAQAVNEYSCWYYYAHDMQQVCFSDWNDVFTSIDSPTFKQAVKEHLFLDANYAAVSPLKKKDALLVTFEGVRQEREKLEMCAEIVKTLPLQSFSQLDDILTEKALVGISDQINGMSGRTLDQWLSMSIEHNQYIETEDGEICITVPYTTPNPA